MNAPDSHLEVPARSSHGHAADHHSQSSVDNDRPGTGSVSRRSTASSVSDLEPFESDYEYGPDVLDGESRPQSPNTFDKQRTNNVIALASVTGKGLPLSPDLHPSLSTEPSEVTDLGNVLEDMKLEDSISSDWQKGWPPDAPLHELLLTDYRKPQPGSKGFFPRGHIKRVLREHAVREELCQSLSGPSEEAIRAKADEYTNWICGPPRAVGSTSKPKSYLKIFAILVLIERVSCIGDFIAEEVDDSVLPLRRVEVKARVGKFELRPRPRTSGRLACFKKWNQVQLMAFDDWQWTVMAPFFSRAADGKVWRYRFPDSSILPFSKEKKQPGESFDDQEFEGGFGKVSKVYIHPDHHNFFDGKTNDSPFALKKLKSRSIEKYKSEFKMLSAFSKTEDPHLVPLRAGYRLRNACYFIFDWADADLSRYWTFTEPRPEFNRDTVLWVAKQCSGLANGLQTIHRYSSIEQSNQTDVADCEAVPGKKLYGMHGDIKPQNILLFKDSDARGTLKICDFGQAELHTVHSRSNRPKTDVAISLFYRPPECDTRDGTISRSYDIWTIGCLYLEFVAWLLGGWKLVKYFAFKRAGPEIPWAPQLREYLFFDRVDGGRTAEVKPCVTQFINWLHSHPNCTDFVHDFLDIIEHQLLVVESTGSEGVKRVGCGPLAIMLRNLCHKCLQIPGYADVPSPTS
ncbi:hypothetical protein ACJ41O_014825 [Fusarium nematophilum]